MGLETEICVLGGGPAGSVIARCLAQLGHRTLIIERDPLGQRQRVESFPPSIISILNSLALSDAIASATFQYERRALVRWKSDSIQEKSFEPATLLVERLSFDRRIRETAVSAGAVVLAPAKARTPTRRPSGGWFISVTAENGQTHVAAEFLIDARGRRGGQARHHGPRTASLSATWHAPGSAYAETRIEAGADEWFWGCPLDRGLYATTIFVDAMRIAGLKGAERCQLHRELLSRSELLHNILSSRMTMPIFIRDATSRIADDLIDKDYIRIGDAAIAIDPLSSQGVQRALLSALQGAAAVHTIRINGDSDAAIAFYRERQQYGAKKASYHAARLYRDSLFNKRPFWLSRSGLTEDAPLMRHAKPEMPDSLPPFVRLSDAVDIVSIPTLCGTVIKHAAALSHPQLEQPIAYVGEIALAPLVAEISNGSATGQLLQCWSSRMRPETAWHILTWMCTLGILERSLPSDPGFPATCQLQRKMDKERFHATYTSKSQQLVKLQGSRDLNAES
jgi:flavin-dependent dehydrogenase